MRSLRRRRRSHCDPAHVHYCRTEDGAWLEFGVATTACRAGGSTGLGKAEQNSQRIVFSGGRFTCFKFGDFFLVLSESAFVRGRRGHSRCGSETRGHAGQGPTRTRATLSPGSASLLPEPVGRLSAGARAVAVVHCGAAPSRRAATERLTRNTLR